MLSHGKSEPTYPHSILMQEPKDMREKNIEPEIYRAMKVTNNLNGWYVVGLHWAMISNLPIDVM
jgi:hypothetical protein